MKLLPQPNLVTAIQRADTLFDARSPQPRNQRTTRREFAPMVGPDGAVALLVPGGEAHQLTVAEQQTIFEPPNPDDWIPQLTEPSDEEGTPNA